MDVGARIERLCAQVDDERALRIAVVAELRTAIAFDAYVWLLTDPVSEVGWSPVADVPVLADLPGLIAAKYLTAVNRWTGLAAGDAVGLVAHTGDVSQSLVWREWQSRWGIADVASVALRDRAGCWGFLDLWRAGGAFTTDELALLGRVATIVTPAVRRSLLPTFAAAGGAPSDGPVVLLLGDDLRPVARTAPVDGVLEALLPADPGRAVVPAAAFNVAAQLGAVEAGVDPRPPQARIHVPERSWMTIRAGRTATAGGAGAATIAVTVEAIDPVDRARLYGRVADLTAREGAVLDAVVAGNDTRHIAQLLGIATHTVQDHLKAVFAKTGADSRRQLAARATGLAGER